MTGNVDSRKKVIEALKEKWEKEYQEKKAVVKTVTNELIEMSGNAIAILNHPRELAERYTPERYDPQEVVAQ